MTSQKKIDANRRNAQASTGPQSQPGKDVSKMNALKYGLSGEFVLLAWEAADEFEEMKSFYLQELRPKGILEYEAAVRVVQDAWRINRSLLNEQEIQERSICADDRDRRLSSLYLAQGRLRRQEERDRRELERLRLERIQGLRDPVENVTFLQPRPGKPEDYESPYLPLDKEEGHRWQEHCYDMALATAGANRQYDSRQTYAQPETQYGPVKERKPAQKKTPAEKKKDLIEKLKPKPKTKSQSDISSDTPSHLGSFDQTHSPSPNPQDFPSSHPKDQA